MEDTLRQWLSVNKTETLTVDEERKLIRKVRAKDALLAELGRVKRDPGSDEEKIIREGREALHTLVEQLIPLGIGYARKYAVRYPDSSLTFEDFEQEAFLGIIHAAGLYSPDRGTRFSTYAVFWIEQYIRRAIEDKGDIIRKPASAHSRLRKIRNCGNSRTPEQISEATGISKKEVEFLTQLNSMRVISLENGQDGENATEKLYEEIADPVDFRAVVEEEMMRKQIRTIIHSIKNEKQRMVMEMHLGLTQSRVCFSNRQISAALGMKMTDVNGVIRKTEQELVMWGGNPYTPIIL